DPDSGGGKGQRLVLLAGQIIDRVARDPSLAGTVVLGAIDIVAGRIDTDEVVVVHGVVGDLPSLNIAANRERLACTGLQAEKLVAVDNHVSNGSRITAVDRNAQRIGIAARGEIVGLDPVNGIVAQFNALARTFHENTDGNELAVRLVVADLEILDAHVADI